MELQFRYLDLDMGTLVTHSIVPLLDCDTLVLVEVLVKSFMYNINLYSPNIGSKEF